MTLGNIVNNIFVVAGGFVVHGNAASDEFQLLILYKYPYIILFLFILFIPPPHEEPDFDLEWVVNYLDEFMVGVGLQFSHIIIDDPPHVEF